MSTKPKRLPTMDEFEQILTYMKQSWVFISDDDMYDLTEEELPSETKAIETLLTDITGEDFEVDRY